MMIHPEVGGWDRYQIGTLFLSSKFEHNELGYIIYVLFCLWGFFFFLEMKKISTMKNV